MTNLIQVTLVFLRLQAHAEPVPIFPVATACCSCSHPEFNSSELNPWPWSQQEYFSKWFASAVTWCSNSVAHIWSHYSHHPNIIFTFTAYYSYQKDERERPENLPKKSHPSSPKQSVSVCLSLLPCFSLFSTLLYLAYVCLSLGGSTPTSAAHSRLPITRQLLAKANANTHYFCSFFVAQ